MLHGLFWLVQSETLVTIVIIHIGHGWVLSHVWSGRLGAPFYAVEIE
jgi:hypothetical protein